MIDPAEIIIVDICSAHRVGRLELISNRREKRLVKARKDAARKLRKLNLSFPAIGKLLNRDHTSIMYYLRGKALEQKPLV